MEPRLNVPVSFIVAAAALVCTAPTLGAQQSIEYTISFPNAEQHEVHVEAVFRGVAARMPLQLRMSRSSPGRYAIHNFAKNVHSVRATDGRGRSLGITRPDPHGWNVSGHDGTVKLTYVVWGDRVDGTYLGVDATHAHMNMPATFMWARGMMKAPVTLKVNPRAGWRVVTQLKPTRDSTVFTAPHVQYFLDSPTEVGPVTMRSWPVSNGTKTYTIRLAVHHLGNEAQVDTFADMAKKIVAEQIAAFGEPPAFDFGTYTFLADYLPWASGDGMEHRNSTILSSRRTLADRTNRLGNLGTLSHEFFHSWNVERLRPRSLEPFDFERENMSGELWFAEGFTNYFDDLFIRRAGLLSDEEFAAAIGDRIVTTINAPGRKYFSAVEMSMQAPFVDAAASIDPHNVANKFLSYYTWGAAIGVGLDLTLRSRFMLTADDYMRELWREFGRHQSPSLAPTKPYTMNDLRRTLGRFTKDTAFANDFFRRYIEGRDVPDYETLLAKAGLLLEKTAVGKPFIGASLADDTTAVFVNWTSESGPFFAAGIANGDLIYSIDGEPTTSITALENIVTSRRVGDVIKVELFQRGQRRTVPVTLVADPGLRVTTYEAAGRSITPDMQAFRNSWLNSRAAR